MMRSSEGLVDSRQHLLGHEFVEARAAAADMALATFEGAGHARQRILHNPDITAILDRAAGRPRCCKSADRPGSPDTWIGGAKQGDRPASGGGGKVSDRCVGSEVDTRPREQTHHLGPFHLMNSSDAVPDVLEIAAF